MELYDKKHRPVAVGDVLKIDHYIARVRREKVYMYKLVIERFPTPKGSELFKISHLSHEGSYFTLIDDKIHNNIEIVQSKCIEVDGIKTDFRHRKKKSN